MPIGMQWHIKPVRTAVCRSRLTISHMQSHESFWGMCARLLFDVERSLWYEYRPGQTPCQLQKRTLGLQVRPITRQVDASCLEGTRRPY